MKTLFLAGAAVLVGAISGPVPQTPFQLVDRAPTGIECTAASVAIRLRFEDRGLAIAIERSLSDAGFRVRLV
jgi:hypothetical protein